MRRNALLALNPVEYRDLREYATHGIMPRLQTLGRFIQVGVVEAGTFSIRDGVREAIAVREREKKQVHLLNGEQMERAVRARKDCPIL